VSDHSVERDARTPRECAERLSDERVESDAGRKVWALWQHGALFHVTTRYPRRRDAPRVDRLAGILRNGLVAPARCSDGSVFSDLNLVVTGCRVPYDSLVFLHRFGSESYLYTLCDPGRFAVFVDPALPVLTPEGMGPNWVLLCQDEVYVPDRVVPEHLRGVAIHPADTESVLRDLQAEFRRLQIPIFDYDGNVLWPQG
jgi:hypothetical protein